MKTCSICKRPLDNLRDYGSLDCGGDCQACMAESGDADCKRAMETQHNMTLTQIKTLLPVMEETWARMTEPDGRWVVPEWVYDWFKLMEGTVSWQNLSQ